MTEFFTPGPRMLDELECAAAVLLAILFGHLVGGQNISWAAFSAYMVMRGHVADTLHRGVLRIIGTATGAALAIALHPMTRTSTLALACCLGVVVAAALYRALAGKYSYAWLFSALTFPMVLLAQLEKPGLSVQHFAGLRLLEVAAGTAACWLVRLLSTYTLRRRWPAQRMAMTPDFGWHPQAARHAAQGGVAVALLVFVHALWNVPELPQAAIAIVALMLVPVERIGASGLRPVTRRIMLRVLGCAAGVVLASAVLLIAKGNTLVFLGGTVLGVMVGRHIENGQHSFVYGGTQFTLAVLVTLVPDSYINPDPHAGFARAAATLVGIALLEPVLVIWHLLATGPK